MVEAEKKARALGKESVDCGAGKKGVARRGGLAERAGRWILQDGLDRQRYWRGKGVFVKTGDAPQARLGISWRDAGEGLICLRPSHHPTSETERERRGRERRRKRPPKTNKP